MCVCYVLCASSVWSLHASGGGVEGIAVLGSKDRELSASCRSARDDLAGQSLTSVRLAAHAAFEHMLANNDGY